MHNIRAEHRDVVSSAAQYFVQADTADRIPVAPFGSLGLIALSHQFACASIPIALGMELIMVARRCCSHSTGKTIISAPAYPMLLRLAP